MFEIEHTWASTGDTGALTAIEVPFPAMESVLYVEHSTLATSNSFEFQTAQKSSGPWFTEASTAMGATAVVAQQALRVSGPYRWMRPQLKTASTGTYNIRLIAVR